MQCYVLYKKGIKAAYLGEISIFKSNFSECFEFINRFKNWVHNYDYIFYMIFFDDGTCGAGYIEKSDLSKIKMFKEDK